MNLPLEHTHLQQSMAVLSRALELQQAGDLAAAANALQKAVRLAPLNGAAWHQLLVLLLQVNDLENAEQVVRILPPTLYAQSASLRHLHSKLLVLQNRAAEAIPLLLALRGNSSIDACDLANDLGSSYSRLGELEKSLDSYRQAFAGGLRRSSLYWSMGTALHKLARFREAECVFQEGLIRWPGDPGLEYEFAHSLLAREQYTRGFPLLRSRWSAAQFGIRPRILPLPTWNGQTRVQSLLVVLEQGVGDQIVYSTLLPALLQRADRVTAAFDPRLFALLRRSFPRIHLIDPKELTNTTQLQQRFDAWISAGDLGAVSTEGIGWRNGQLQADTAQAAALRAGYQTRFPGKRLVGITWRSSRPVQGELKTVDILDWGPILQQPDCQFISLQYGDTAADIERARTAFGVTILQDPAIDAFNDLDGLAAQAKACDLIISTSNTSAHVAAATGTPTWVILPHSRGLLWYWGLREPDCAWYPQARLFRASTPHSWQAVMGRIAASVLHEGPWSTIA